MSRPPYRITFRLTRTRVTLAIFAVVFVLSLAVHLAGSHSVTYRYDGTNFAVFDHACADLQTSRGPWSYNDCVTMWEHDGISQLEPNTLTPQALSGSLLIATIGAGALSMAWWLVSTVRVGIRPER